MMNALVKFTPLLTLTFEFYVNACIILHQLYCIGEITCLGIEAGGEKEDSRPVGTSPHQGTLSQGGHRHQVTPEAGF